LRIKKQFTDQERDAFLDESFEYVANFFEGSLAELQNRNEGIAGRFRRVTSDRFTAEVYRHGKSVSGCCVRLAAFYRNRHIAFSDDPNETNSMNESIEASDDGYTQSLKISGFSHRSSDSKAQLTQQGLAELMWGWIIGRLQ
jgi:hypothetical protein